MTLGLPGVGSHYRFISVAVGSSSSPGGTVRPRVFPPHCDYCIFHIVADEFIAYSMSYHLVSVVYLFGVHLFDVCTVVLVYCILIYRSVQVYRFGVLLEWPQG